MTITRILTSIGRVGATAGLYAGISVTKSAAIAIAMEREQRRLIEARHDRFPCDGCTQESFRDGEVFHGDEGCPSMGRETPLPEKPLCPLHGCDECGRPGFCTMHPACQWHADPIHGRDGNR